MKKFLLLIVIIFVYFLQCSYAGEYAIAEYQGLQTTENALLIPDNKSPDMDNCEITKHGQSISRRDGQTRLFTLGLSSYSARSFGSVINSNYDRILVGYASRVEAYDTGYSRTVIHSTAAVGYVWDFTQNLGYTYATNGINSVFYTDGNTRYTIGNAPKGTSIVFFNNTCWIANTQAYRGRVYYSGYGEPTNWTTGVNPTDAASLNVADYGQQVVDLEVLNNSVLVLCSGSIMKFVGVENPYQLIEIDKSMGCLSKGSVCTFNGYTYFLSSKKQICRTDGNGIEILSTDDIEDKIANLAQANFNTYFQSWSSEDDFKLGITSYTSHSISPGNVVCSSGVKTYTTQADWNSWTLTNVDTDTVSGSMTLKAFGYLDQFADGNYSSGPTWTAGASGWAVSSQVLACSMATVSNYIYTHASSGTFTHCSIIDYQFKVRANSDDYYVIFKFGPVGTSSISSVGCQLKFGTLYGDPYSYLALDYYGYIQPTDLGLDIDTWYTIRIRLTSNSLKLYVDGVEKITYTTSFTGNFAEGSNPSFYIYVRGPAADASKYIYIDDIYSALYSAQGGQGISPVIDTKSTRPVWGSLIWTGNTWTGATYSFSVRSSSVSDMSNNPTWISHSLTSENETVDVSTNVANYQYVQIKSTMTTANVAVTPEISGVSLTWKTTGYYITKPISIPSITTWGLFENTYSLNDGTLSFYVATSSYQVSSSSLQANTEWFSINDGELISCPTNFYIYSKVIFGLTDGTNNPTVNDITVNWQSGNPLNLMDVTTRVWKERLYFGCMDTGKSRNDQIYVYDPEMNLATTTSGDVTGIGGWWVYKSGVYPSVLYDWNNRFIIASSSSNVVSEFLSGNTDLGEEINAYYYTKMISPKPLNIVSSFDVLSLLFDKQSTGNLYIDYFLNASTNKTGSVIIPMTGNLPLKVYTLKFPESINAYTIQYKIYNQNGEDFTFHQLLGTTNEKPLKIGSQ